MTTPDTILTVLAQSRATTAAVAESVRVPFLVAQAMIHRLAKDGLVDSIPDPNLDLWQLSDSGKARAESLTASA